MAELEPFYPKGKGRGRPPIGSERMLRIMCIAQQCFGLSDEGLDATIIAAPSSTKNQSGKRDPEMHQTKSEASGILA